MSLSLLNSELLAVDIAQFDGRVKFYDQHPHTEVISDEVIDCLGRQQPTLPCKYFYDDKGADLFCLICEQDEYYLTNAEFSILTNNIDEIAACAGSQGRIIDPGSGDSQKVRMILNHIAPSCYVPVDISKDQLMRTAGDMAAQYKDTQVHALCADYSEPLELPDYSGGGKSVVYFPGSSIGNFEPEDARLFLQQIHAVISPGDGLLIAADLRKCPKRLEAAYKDEAGITAALNLNILCRLNRDIAANLDRSHFRHQATYQESAGRIEMHLVSIERSKGSIQGVEFEFEPGQTIHTENCYKYDLGEFCKPTESIGFSSK